MTELAIALGRTHARIEEPAAVAFPSHEPDDLEVDHVDCDGQMTLDTALASAKKRIYAGYRNQTEHVLRITRALFVGTEGIDFGASIAELMESREQIPFEICAFGGRHVWRDYSAPGLSLVISRTDGPRRGTIRDGIEIRIDDTYEVPVTTAAWVVG